VIGPIAPLLIALLLTGIVHLASVLALPWLAPRDAFSRLAELAQDNAMTVVAQDRAAEALPYSDPAVATAICRYVLDRGPVRVRLRTGVGPMSLLFLRKGAGIYHSLSDKAATQGVLDAVVATPQQMEAIIERDSDDDAVQEIRITSSDIVGLVVVHALVPTHSQRPQVERSLRQATCEVESLDD